MELENMTELEIGIYVKKILKDIKITGRVNVPHTTLKIQTVIDGKRYSFICGLVETKMKP